MKKFKFWRESASIIIAAQNGFNNNQSYNYNLLFLKRHKTANSFANSFVFPGGVLELADSNLKWYRFFKDNGYNENSFKSLFPSTKKRPEIFLSLKNELPREISLRLCAIRETFEECGILLCKKSHGTTISDIADNFSIPINELEYWQNKVHSDANEFYNMCEKLQCFPNLWGLHEWGNWITPVHLPIQARFNTAFFFASLPQIPMSKLECAEMEELLWTTPENIKAFKSFLPPPQQYSVSKIEEYQSLDSLLHFVLENSKNGIQQFFPVKVILLDGTTMLLPGDAMYPEKLNLQNQEPIQKSSMTIKQFRNMSSKIHRIEYFNNSIVKVTRLSES